MASPRGVLAILNTTFRGYRPTLIALALLGTLGALVDGVTVNAVIPLVSFLLGPSSPLPTDRISSIIRWLFSVIRVPYQFKYLLLFIAALLILRATVQACFVLMRAYANARFLSEETGRVFKLTLAADWQFIAHKTGGYLQNTILWDTKRASQLLDTIVQFLQSGTGFLMYLLVAVNISAGITLVTIVAGGILLFVLRPLIRKTRHFGEETAIVEKELAQRIGEHVAGFKAVKAAGVAEAVYESAQSELARLRSLLERTIFVQSLGSIFIQPAGFLFAMAIFAFSYYRGTFSIAIFAAILYLIQKIFTYLDSTQASMQSIVQLVPFADNVLAFEAEARASKEVAAEAAEPFSFERSISFNDASFSYKNGAPVLSGVSFQIPKGSLVGIVGPSGSGKTTAVDLLLRLFKPSSGKIAIDGVSIDAIRLDDWRKKVAYVSQDSFIMHASVSENIRFYDESVSDEDVVRAAKLARIHDDVMRMPQGFDTMIGDRGATLSGGQRQRLSLARVFAKSPEILVLDEVTSAMDSELESQIKEAIDAVRGSMTLVVIAHRISTILDADSVVVLREGAVVAQGKPRDMLADPDSYLSRIVGMQGSALS